jgi:hypothetical protein
MGNFLNREALLKRQVLEIKKVEFENGDFVFVKEMSAGDRDMYEKTLTKAIRNGKGVLTGYETIMENFRSKLACATLCDEEGQLMLKPEDVPALSQAMGIVRMDKIIEVANALNKITKEDEEEIIKNSSADQPGSLNSDYVKN